MNCLCCSISPNSRKQTGRRWRSPLCLLAPEADIGGCRNKIGPTVRVEPIILRLFGGFRALGLGGGCFDETRVFPNFVG